MDRSLSRFVDNLSEGIHSEKCGNCKFHLDYMLIKDDKLIFRCFEFKKIMRKNLIKN